jgi:hypothetical protein
MKDKLAFNTFPVAFVSRNTQGMNLIRRLIDVKSLPEVTKA